MLQRIHRFITDNGLPQPPSQLLIALSGGADSVALLLIMKQLGYEVVAAHCNFHLRGDESNRDELFVRSLCAEQQVELHVQHFNTAKTAANEGISIEMAARQLRYDWFEEIRQSTRSVAIAVAHHSDDNAETLLLNLVRGTGIRGLKGMLPQNGYIIRPLLDIRREELETYLQEKKQPFVTDSTNLETVYKRNKIRHEVLPLLRQLNPNIDLGLAQTAQRLAEAEVLYRYAITDIRKKVAEQLNDGIRIRLADLKAHPMPGTVLHELLQPYGFSAAETAQIAKKLDLQTGKLFEARAYLAVIHRGQLEVRKKPVPFPSCPLSYDEERALPNSRRIRIRRLPREELADIPKSATTVALDADSIEGQLMARSCIDGDRFRPYGMKGSKLVSDYLTDRHRSLIDKLSSYCLCDDKGIVWLAEERVAQRVAITPTTRKVLLISISR